MSLLFGRPISKSSKKRDKNFASTFRNSGKALLRGSCVATSDLETYYMAKSFKGQVAIIFVFVVTR
jgi:hypothetical protein